MTAKDFPKYTTIDITCVLNDASTWSTQLFGQHANVAVEAAELALTERVAKGRDKDDRWNKPVIVAFTFCNLTRERREYRVVPGRTASTLKLVKTVVVM